MGIGLLIGLWLLVLANLLGLIDVARSRYEDRATRLIGLVIGVLTTILLSALLIVLTPLLLAKITNSAYENPNVRAKRETTVCRLAREADDT